MFTFKRWIWAWSRVRWKQAYCVISAFLFVSTFTSYAWNYICQYRPVSIKLSLNQRTLPINKYLASFQTDRLFLPLTHHVHFLCPFLSLLIDQSLLQLQIQLSFQLRNLKIPFLSTSSPPSHPSSGVASKSLSSLMAASSSTAIAPTNKAAKSNSSLAKQTNASSSKPDEKKENELRKFVETEGHFSLVRWVNAVS